MARKRRHPRRPVLPDPKFSEEIITRFVNNMMMNGKRGISESILYGAFDIVEERFKEKGLDVFNKAFDNVRPMVEVRSRRVGGATYQVPTEVRPSRRDALALTTAGR